MHQNDRERRDDEFLTALSRGIDPSHGSDELAAAFLALREEVEAPMPQAPLIDGGGGTSSEPPTQEQPAVVSLEERRKRRSRTNPWTAGLVGAAAATVLVAGSGAALYNATPGSPLWGPSQALFGEDTNYVELAGALDEIETKTESGDIAGARLLIEQMRESLKAAERPQKQERDGGQRERAKETVTVTTEPKKRDGAPAPSPAAPPTETVTVTVVVTEPAAPAAPAAQGSNQPAPAHPSAPAAPAPQATAPANPPATPTAVASPAAAAAAGQGGQTSSE